MPSHVISDGPGIVLSALIPDFHHFNTRGGRALPYLYPDGTPNLAPGLTRALADELRRDVTSAGVLAYIAAVVAHPAYTRTFADELTTPGIRVPVTRDPDLWVQAARLGEEIIWLHTYGTVFAGPGRPEANVRLPAGDPSQPLSTRPVRSMPETMSYDTDRATVFIGDGEFAPVRHGVWEYAVGGRNVLRSWFNYRKRDPGGKQTSQLDHLSPTAWDPDWTTEFIDLLTVLTRLTTLEPSQASLLTRILTGPLLSAGDLQAAGTRWPGNPKARRPRYGYDSLRPTESPEGQGTLGM